MMTDRFAPFLATMLLCAVLALSVASVVVVGMGLRWVLATFGPLGLLVAIALMAASIVQIVCWTQQDRIR